MKGVVLILCILASSACVSSQQAVLLKDVKSLTLHKGRMTNGRRSAPVHQMMCVGGNGCGKFEPDVIRCENAGVDDKGEVQWTCRAEMPKEFRFGRTDVSCEGYSHPNDPYILSGSCGVEYTLHTTRAEVKTQSPPYRSKSDKEFLFLLGLCICIFLTAVVFIAINSTITPHAPEVIRERESSSPAYNPAYFQPPASTNSTPQVHRARQRKFKKKKKKKVVIHHHHPQENANTGSDFWTGAVVGAVASSWANSAPEPNPPRSYSPPAASPPPSSSTHTSTGYGGTKRR